jgi:P4 family phage/plasmid primase-like protien
MSVFKNIYDSGQMKSFAFKDEDKPPRNPLWVTREDEGKEFASNAQFVLNSTTTWGDLVDMLVESSSEAFATKEDARLLSPTVYETRLWLKSSAEPCRGFRGEKNATGSGMVVVDADAGLTISEALDRLRQEGVECIVYTTASNRIGDKFRVAVPLLTPVDVETQKRAVLAVCQCLKAGWAPDTTKVNSYSLFYLPGTYAKAVNQFEHLHGIVRTAQQWVDLYPVAEPEPTPEVTHTLNRDSEWSPEKCGALDRYRSLSGGRHKGLFAMMVSLAMSAINAKYDIRPNELADIADHEQRGNPPARSSSRYTQSGLVNAAYRAIELAGHHAHDPAYLRRESWDAYQLSEWDRIKRELEDERNTEPAIEGDDLEPDYDAESDYEPETDMTGKNSDELLKAAEKLLKMAKKRQRREESEAKKVKSPAYDGIKLQIGSDVEIANLVHRIMTRDDNHVYAEGGFYRWTGRVWEILDKDDVTEEFITPFDGARYGDKGVRLTKSKVDSILSFVEHKLTKRDFFDGKKPGINLQNGFIEFDRDGTYRLTDHDRMQLSRHVLPGSYWPGFAKLPPDSLLRRFLDTMFKDDPEAHLKIMLVQEIAGAALIGSSQTWLTQPKCVILYGRMANNGKSELLALLEGLIGSCSHVAAHQFDEKNIVIGLRGQLLNTAGELTSAHAVASETFKEAITGGVVHGKLLYRDIIGFRPHAQHVFATNRLPPFTGGIDRGCRRRLLVLDFINSIAPEDMIPDIARKVIETEYGWILNWAIEGASRLIKNDSFTIPPSSIDALNEWVRDTDPVTAWASERVRACEVSGTGYKPSDVMQYFYTWAEQHFYDKRYLPKLSEFTNRMAEMFPGCKRTSNGSRFKGITILTSDPTDIQDDLRRNPPTRADEYLWDFIDRADDEHRQFAHVSDD